MIIKQSTAKKLPCLLYDKTDFITPKEGVGHASVSVNIQKHGAARYPYDMGASQVTAAFESAATGGSTTTLVDSALAGKYADGYFAGLLIRTVSGAGNGQNLAITGYTGATGTFTFAAATAPDSTTVYRVCKGVADSAGANTIADSILTETNGYWNGYEIQIIAGTGAGQVRTVVDFVSATNTITVDSNWATQPDATSVYSLCDKWRERGGGLYDISFDADELDTCGSFIYSVSDGRTNCLDYNGLVTIESATNSDIKSDIAGLPTAAMIDTQLTGTHGSGAWLTYNGGLGTGQYTATIHVEDESQNDVANAKVTVHNAGNDDTPFYGPVTTDVNGDAVFTIEGSVYARVSKAGYAFGAAALNVTASGTYTVSGTSSTVTPPSDPALCRLYLFPITMDNQDITNLTINISSRTKLTRVNGEFIQNTSMTFTYDSSTAPDSYYFDAVQGADTHITCSKLGLDHDVTVPAAATKDLSELVGV